MDQLGVRYPADLYRLTESQLLALEGFKEKRAQNIIRAIQEEQGLPTFPAFGRHWHSQCGQKDGQGFGARFILR